MRFEQAVYGSFPFWNRGYGVLAHSPGCRPEWLAELRTVCQRFGEPPAGTPHVEGLFALRLRSGPWLVAGVHSQGCDDRGRPGALAFHGLFIGRFAYAWAGSDPFAFKHQIRHNWRGRPGSSPTDRPNEALAKTSDKRRDGPRAASARDHDRDRGKTTRDRAIERADRGARTVSLDPASASRPDACFRRNVGV